MSEEVTVAVTLSVAQAQAALNVALYLPAPEKAAGLPSTGSGL